MMHDEHKMTRSPGRFRMGKRWVAALALTVGAGTVTAAGIGIAQAGAATTNAPVGGCADVDFAFTRGSGELPGLGIVGTPLLAELRADLPGKSVSVWANPYGASLLQTTASPGATNLTQHIVQVAQACPNTKFVIGGYSQGASVVDISIGIPTLLGVGQHIPTSLAPRIAALLTFGNPLKLFGQTIAMDSPLYGPKNDNFCNLGDPVCANGIDVFAHLLYGINGDTNQAAAFAAQKVNALG